MSNVVQGPHQWDRKLDAGGGGGNDGGMETRLAALESEIKEVRKDLSSIRERLAGIDGKLSNMPSTFQMMSWFVGVSLGLVGVVFAIARTVGVH